ncbi:MAG TPA: HEAT repeat domain-containing protein, partial [Planctomycetota bacterium]|nr:HEAT repeat domain-containing protein [Planctomycetota bacterium]
MRRREAFPLVALCVLLAAGAGPATAQDGGGGEPPPPAPPPAPPPQDPPPVGDRFFPKELADALAALVAAESDDEARFESLIKISRMRPLEGATEPLKTDAFAPVLAKALSTRQDTFADCAGAFLAALDRPRLADELKKQATGDDAVRLRNATFLAENLGGPEGAKLLAGPLAGSSAREVRVRAVEALGLLGAKEGFDVAVALVRDADFELRNTGALALGRIGDPRAVPHLLAGLGEAKGFYGWYCAEALTMIEDPGILPALLARPSSGSGAGPRARAIEGCARAPHLDQVLALVAAGNTAEVRAAAAYAVGRLVAEDPSGGTLTPERREAVADMLLEGTVSDREATVRAACLWSLRKCTVPSTGGKAFKRLSTVKGEDRVLFLLTLLGEAGARGALEEVVSRKDQPVVLLRTVAANTILQNGILGAKEPMIRRASGVAFWQIADADTVKTFRERILNASDAGVMERLCEALGSWKSKEGFDLAVSLLAGTREGSREQFSVMLALEKMTGHWFGPYPGLWQKWFSRNAGFFTPKQAKVEREKWREEFDKENKGFRHTKETERAVQMGLGWLARHQGWDGIWDCSGFAQKCDPRAPCSRQAGARTQFSQAGFTGLACIAYSGAGYSPSAGKFRHTLKRGLDSLVATQGVDGDWFDQADYLWNRSYARPVALQALAEGYASGGDPRYRAAAERIMARQFALMNMRGGWRYSLHRDV